MDNSFYKLFSEFESHLDIGMSKDIQVFLYGRKEISSYDITLDQEEKVIIDIKLYTFSQKNCKELFLSFLAFVGYNDINLFICEKKPEKIRYLYLTQSATCKGVKMEIAIS